MSTLILFSFLVNSPSQTYIQEVSQTNLMDGRNTTSSGGSLTSESMVQ